MGTDSEANLSALHKKNFKQTFQLHVKAEADTAFLIVLMIVFKRWAIPGLFFFIFVFSIGHLADKSFANVWI